MRALICPAKALTLLFTVIFFAAPPDKSAHVAAGAWLLLVKLLQTFYISGLLLTSSRQILHFGLSPPTLDYSRLLYSTSFGRIFPRETQRAFYARFRVRQFQTNSNHCRPSKSFCQVKQHELERGHARLRARVRVRACACVCVVVRVCSRQDRQKHQLGRSGMRAI